MRIVTAIDEDYYPGLVALSNSIKKNSPETELVCMVYGNKSLVAKVKDLGVEVIDRPKIKANLPITKEWPIASKAMYARLLIPDLFKDEKIAWLDADCIVLKSLKGLDEINFTQPVAAVKTSTTTLGQQVIGLKKDHNVSALFAGLLIFNCKVWKESNITEKCFQAMEEKLDFKYVVQSVLSYVLKGNFKEIDYYWQAFANRKETTQNLHRVKILHYVGGLPWKTDMRNKNIWESYC